MRQEILDYIGTLPLGSFSLTAELPWDNSGSPLFIKNPKRIYVASPDYATDPIIQTLNGLIINNDVISVKIYFSSDAKTQPPDYDTLLSDLRTTININPETIYSNRQTIISKSFENDMLVTEIELRFTKLL